MNYTHLTIEERCCIREFYKKGKSYREIAKLIGKKKKIFSCNACSYDFWNKQKKEEKVS